MNKMARKKVEIVKQITNEKGFEHALNEHKKQLICAEVYSGVFGPCTALDRMLTLMKMSWSVDEVVILRNHRVTQVLMAVDSRRFEIMAKSELRHFKAGDIMGRTTYAIDEYTPDEMEQKMAILSVKQKQRDELKLRREARQSLRKRHRAQNMIPYLKEYNFVMFWPHAHHAHPELYERWDLNNIIMVRREEVTLNKDETLDVLYLGDAPINEASIHALMAGPALLICFRILDKDKDIVSLVRRLLYEEPFVSKHDASLTAKSAYEHYKTISSTREMILRKRKEEQRKQREEEKRNRACFLAEKHRLARLALEQDFEEKKMAKEHLKFELLKAGKLDELEKLKQQPEDVMPELPIEEEEAEAEEQEQNDEGDPDEYFPPAGLVVPGLYAPPNEEAKTNGLALFFSSLVLEFVKPLPEFLPPHVLVMLQMDKRLRAIRNLQTHVSAIIHMGIFRVKTPYDAVHIAYSVKQYESMGQPLNIDDLRICFMLSVAKDIPLLDLMELSPPYVSRHSKAGEEECAAMFDVDYADNYPELEDFGPLLT